LARRLFSVVAGELEHYDDPVEGVRVAAGLTRTLAGAKPDRASHHPRQRTSKNVHNLRYDLAPRAHDPV
jgi:hypothetical protein